MALTGRKKYLIREMLASSEPKNIRLAEVILKSANYTSREIEHWKETIQMKKEASIKKILNKWTELPGKNYIKYAGPIGSELFHELVKREADKFLKEGTIGIIT